MTTFDIIILNVIDNWRAVITSVQPTHATSDMWYAEKRLVTFFLCDLRNGIDVFALDHCRRL